MYFVIQSSFYRMGILGIMQMTVAVLWLVSPMVALGALLLLPNNLAIAF